VKIAVLILSIYLAALSVIPCCAFDDCPEEKANHAQIATHQAGDEDDCGTCSPFFNCAGCGSVSISLQHVVSQAMIAESVKDYPSFLIPLVSDAQYDFWQPPRSA
jgi:hypothetical protein